MDASHVYVHAWALGSFHSLISTQTFRRVLTASVDSCTGIECPFSGVTKSGRVWRKVPESDAQSVQCTPPPLPILTLKVTGLVDTAIHPYKQNKNNYSLQTVHCTVMLITNSSMSMWHSSQTVHCTVTLIPNSSLYRDTHPKQFTVQWHSSQTAHCTVKSHSICGPFSSVTWSLVTAAGRFAGWTVTAPVTSAWEWSHPGTARWTALRTDKQHLSMYSKMDRSENRQTTPEYVQQDGLLWEQTNNTEYVQQDGPLWEQTNNTWVCTARWTALRTDKQHLSMYSKMDRSENRQTTPEYVQQDGPLWEQTTPEYVQQDGPLWEQTNNTWVQQDGPLWEQTNNTWVCTARWTALRTDKQHLSMYSKMDRSENRQTTSEYVQQDGPLWEQTNNTWVQQGGPLWEQTNNTWVQQDGPLWEQTNNTWVCTARWTALRTDKQHLSTARCSMVGFQWNTNWLETAPSLGYHLPSSAVCGFDPGIWCPGDPTPVRRSCSANNANTSNIQFN